MEIDEYVLKFARLRAWQLSGHYGFLKDDKEDILQQLLLDYWRRLPNYDETCASMRTFGRYVVDHHVASLIAAQRARRRDYRLLESLEDLPDRGLRFSSQEPDPFRVFSCNVIARTIAGLNPEQRKVAMLIRDAGVSEVARELCVSRSWVHRRLRQIRLALEAAGFGPTASRRSKPSKKSLGRRSSTTQIVGPAGI